MDVSSDHIIIYQEVTIMLQNAKRRTMSVRSERIAARKERDAEWMAELKAVRGDMDADAWLKANDPKYRKR